MSDNEITEEQQDEDIILSTLTKVRAEELTAISQYMGHAYRLNADGYEPFAEKMEEIAKIEMKHAEVIGKRIAILGKVAGHRKLFTPKTVETVTILQMADANMELEINAIGFYNDAITVCREQKDNVSANILNSIIMDEQEHMEFFQDVSNLVKTHGDVYIVKWASGPK
ncbi:MAG: ferritin-like domain-containing protein [Nanoarchaeota archaeon]